MADYLSGGVPLAASALAVLETPGEVFTYLPSDAPDDIAVMFGSARALHPAFAYASAEDWGAAWRDSSYPLTPSGRSPLVDEIRAALAEPSSVLRSESDVTPCLEAHAPVSSDELKAALIDSYVMGTFVVVVADGQGSVTLIAVEAYDGEGFVAWKALGSRASV